MTKLRVLNFSISLDGYGAGPNQDLTHPLGENFTDVMDWFFPTQVFHRMRGGTGGETGTDNKMAEDSLQNLGSWILGRNMFGPIRGPWPDDNWKGWWGEEPPYHVPVFVLTHHKRPSFKMKGGTEFIFVTDGIESAFRQAKAAAGEKDIRIGGGVSTIHQYLKAGLVDDLHLAVRPVLMGRGENFFKDIDLRALGYECEKSISGERATHVFFQKKGSVLTSR